MRWNPPCDCGLCPDPGQAAARRKTDVPEPRCDRPTIPNTRLRHRCERPVVLRVLLAHGPGVAKYGNRCAIHAARHLDVLVAAIWDPVRWKWVWK